MLLLSKKLYVLTVITDATILYMAGKQVISRQFLGILVSLDFGRRYVTPCVNHLELGSILNLAL